MIAEPLQDGHKILGDDNYCHGYMDPFGVWNTGFPCPSGGSQDPTFCCGTNSLKYCCVKEKADPKGVPHLSLLLGLAVGVLVALLSLAWATRSRCCRKCLQGRRKPETGNSPYQMARPSALANVLTNASTPTQTSTSRSSVLSCGDATPSGSHVYATITSNNNNINESCSPSLVGNLPPSYELPLVPPRNTTLQGSGDQHIQQPRSQLHSFCSTEMSLPAPPPFGVPEPKAHANPTYDIYPEFRI